MVTTTNLAKIYHVETKRINEAVKNNPLKFPKRYSWYLTDKESKSFLVENFGQKMEIRGCKYKNPHVFTEQGVYMLRIVLKSDTDTKKSIDIMDAFNEKHNLWFQFGTAKGSQSIFNRNVRYFEVEILDFKMRIKNIITMFNNLL